MADKPKPKPQGLTAAIKKKYVSDLADAKKNPTKHISVAIQRLSEWAASGHYPTGLTYEDLKWMYDQACKELKKRDPKSTAGGNFPAAGSGKKSAVPDAEERCQALSSALSAAAEPADDEHKSAAPAVEHRAVPLAAFDGLDGDDDHAQRFHGHAAVFNQWTQIGSPKWGFRERIAPGAFAKTIQESDQVFLDSHDGARVLSRRSAGTLRLAEDAVGLAVDSDIPKTTIGADFAENVRNGNIKGMSFGFRVVKDDWERDEDGAEARTIREAHLLEVSGTAFPAYDGTDAGIRAVVAARSARAQRADSDPDDDPACLAGAVDAAIDQAMCLFAGADLKSLPADVAQGIQVVAAADAAVDQLLDLMGVYDPDDDDSDSGGDSGRSREPAPATRDSDDPEPDEESTRRADAHRAMRHQALALVYGSA